MIIHSARYSQSISALKVQLLQQLPRLSEYLFTGRVIHRMRHEYRIGKRGSKVIRLADGIYFDHETGEGGDILCLIQRELKINFKGALVWARGFVGNAALPPLPHIEVLQKKYDARAARQRDKALAIWRRSKPITGTLAEKYLREHRGIIL